MTMTLDVTGARRSVLAEITAEGGNPMRAFPPGPGLAAQVRGLVERYPGARRLAVAGLCSSVRRGEMLGVLGPGGAGPTTTVGVLDTRVASSAGEVTASRSRWPWCR
ncbi:hypothetical protein [Actinoalloteichus caeruleus]|uniref:hypothetical protein n=1 Tax=Actinoalloteichus cyanogriseus TaxID=2893586 RepID=UPI003AAD2601